MIYSIINIAAVLFELVVTFMFFEYFSEWRSSKLSVKIISRILFFAMVCIGNYYIKVPYLMAMVTIIIYYITAMFFEGTFKRRMFIVFGYMALVLISELLAVTIMLIADSTVHDLMADNGMQRMLGTVISKIILLCLIKVVCIFSEKGRNKVYINYWLALLTIPAVNLYLLITMTAFLYNINKKISFPILVTVIAILYTTVLVFYLFDKILGLSGTCTLLGNQVLYQAGHSAEEKNEKERIQAIKHDLKNHFQVLYKMLYYNKNNEAKKYLESLGVVNDLSANCINTGNTAIDSILSSKKASAESKGIEFKFKTTIPCNLPMGIIDQCVLLGNLLDNAIEACERVTNAHRFVELVLVYSDDCLICSVKNSFAGKIMVQGNLLKTSKGDYKNHGIGSKNIQKVIKKYDGLSKTYVKENVFCIEITLFDLHI